jgi:hypothetical protein
LAARRRVRLIRSVREKFIKNAVRSPNLQPPVGTAGVFADACAACCVFARDRLSIPSSIRVFIYGKNGLEETRSREACDQDVSFSTRHQRTQINAEGGRARSLHRLQLPPIRCWRRRAKAAFNASSSLAFATKKAPADCPCGLLKLWQLKCGFLGAQVSYN